MHKKEHKQLSTEVVLFSPQFAQNTHSIFSSSYKDFSKLSLLSTPLIAIKIF